MSGRKYDIIPQNGDDLKLGIVAAIDRVTQQIFENTWREIKYRLEILRAMKGAHFEVV
jgi:hypothetical protein